METLNTERFHKRDPQKRDQYRTPGSKGVAMIYQMHWAASETAGQDEQDVLVEKMDRLCKRQSNNR